MQQPILTPQQLEAYNRGEAVTIQKIKEVKRPIPDGAKTYHTVFGWNKDFVGNLWLWNNYLAFSTKEELQKEMQYIEARSYIRTYIANNFGEWKPDWSDEDTAKIYPIYDEQDKVWVLVETWCEHIPQPYPFLQTYEQGKQFLRDCEPQLNILRDFWN